MMSFSDSRTWHRLQWHLPFVWVVTLVAMTTTVTWLCSWWRTRFWRRNFLGALAKQFQKVIISFVMSVCPSVRPCAWNSSAHEICFRRGVAETFALLGCYTAYGRSCLLTDVSARSIGPHLRQSSSLLGLLDCRRSELGSPWTDFRETLYWGFLVQTWEENYSSAKIRQKYHTLYTNTYVHLRNCSL